MSEPAVIEDFYGVYLLYSLNEKFSGRTYIGFTVNPNRRIKQHNKGIIAGGARKTSNKGPWKMILIVHGFPNSIAALRFEWAWQNPSYSRRLNHIEHKKRMPRKETHLKYCIRILSEMLRVGPWNRLPLVIRWLEEDYGHDFNGLKLPPFHMPICYGKIKSKKICPPSQLASGHDNKNILDDIMHKKSDRNKCLDSDSDDENIISKNNDYCTICTKIIDFPNRKLSCLNTKCNLVSHMNCLAELFLEDGEYIPIQGDCPSCKKKLLWGDLIRKLKGCKDLQDELFSDHSESDATDDEFEVLSDAMSISSLSEKFDGSDSNDE